jgi:hypothetical protein
MTSTSRRPGRVLRWVVWLRRACPREAPELHQQPMIADSSTLSICRQMRALKTGATHENTLVMRRSGVRFPQGGSRALSLVNAGFPPRRHLHRPVPRPAVPRGAPEPLGRLPQIAVNHVPVQVHPHCSCGMPQDSLNHFRISARCQPHRSRTRTKRTMADWLDSLGLAVIEARVTHRPLGTSNWRIALPGVGQPDDPLTNSLDCLGLSSVTELESCEATERPAHAQASGTRGVRHIVD